MLSPLVLATEADMREVRRLIRRFWNPYAAPPDFLNPDKHIKPQMRKVTQYMRRWRAR